jgi:ATP-dependent RNA helicase RhlB
MRFTELNFHPDIQKGLEEALFEVCTPVQQMTFEQTLAGRDVYVQSQTGTGKTAAFLLTIFHLFKSGGDGGRKKAIVIVPTRELAVQVEEEAMILGKYCGFKTGSFYGGVGYEKQDKLLKADIDIYIGTPGRLIDYCKSKKLDLSQFDVLIIDEADRMFDMGFVPDIMYMIKKMKPPTERLTMLYSATLSQRVKQLAWEYMNDPVEIEIEPENITLDVIKQELYHVSKEEKFSLLMGIIRRDNPESMLLFTNTRRMAEILSKRLAANGIRNEYISGDLPQKKRLQIISDMKDGKTRVLVATDVAARGLHIDDLVLVINYDLPDDCENYVHRIGRTARAGKAGRAVSLACESYVYNLEAIESFIKMKLEVVWPEEGLFVRDLKSYRDDGDRYGRDSRDSRDGRRGSKDRDSRGRDKERGSSSRRDSAPARGGKPRTAAAASTAGSEDRRPAARRGKEEKPADQKRAAQPAAEKRVDRTTEKKFDKKYDKKKSTGARHEKDSDNNIKLRKGASEKERLEYYRNKYGENFGNVPAAGDASAEQPRKGIIGKILSIFKKG